ncbi:MAG: exodeoxyribonuclease III, partial [Verrucomicrobiota bacterium]|nr:exodeoxyribonuclease III [Verrucomicrobiota bacterium]
MKFISWNVNGIRAAIKKGFCDFFDEMDADFFCIQETKARPEQVDLDWNTKHHSYWNSAEKAGYSGTAIFSKIEPKDVFYGIGITQHDKEGRVITLRFDDFYLVNVYTPNSQNELRRLEYRQSWDKAFLKYLKSLDKKRPVILCGDLNVAHTEIDLARPKANTKNPGFTNEEREGFDKLVEANFV